MKRLIVSLALLALGPAALAGPAAAADEKADGGRMIAHNVYFTLKDNSPAAREKLVAACKKYLSDHPGTVAFGAGVREEGLDRDVNDKDFDVSLHIVFKDKAAHDRYQDADQHKKFIAENKDNWKKVRVFDTKLEVAQGR